MDILSLFDLSPFGMTIIAIAAAAGLLTWWITREDGNTPERGPGKEDTGSNTGKSA